MKGLLAPVLVMMMTGMVFSQSNNNFSSSSNDSGIKLLRRFLLVMSDAEIRMLKTEGSLPAAIPAGDQASTDHIEFHGSVANAERSDSHPYNITQTASLDGDGRLEFLLSDALIEVMRKEGLRYIIRKEDRGKYPEVLVRYDGELLGSSRTSQTNERQQERFTATQPLLNQQLRTQQTRDQQSRVQQTRDQLQLRTQQTRNQQQQIRTQPERNQFAQRRTQNEEQNFRSLSRDDSPFVGPQLPDNYFENEQEPRFTRSETDFRRERQTATLTPRRETTYENDFENRSTGSNTRIIGSNVRRNDNSLDLRPRTNRFASETTMTARDLDRELALERENDRLLAEQRAERLRQENERSRLDEMLAIRRDQTQLVPRDNWITRSNRDEQSDLAYENEKLKRLLEDERSDNVQRERTLERELDREYRTRVAAENDRRRRSTELDYPYANNNRRLIDFPTGRFQNRYEPVYNDHLIDEYRPQDSYTQMPAKVASAPRPTSKPPAFSIPGIESNQQENVRARDRNGTTITGDANEVVQRQNRLLWFIMLCSVGLNFYLAIIARGFYVRYEELADEIRETFTSSV